jgi:Tfp pilus assembly pilus retraction ATPase PilT
MNKRIKKKRELEGKVKCLETMLDYAIREIIRQDKEIEELKQINSRNAQATNSRFDKLEKQVADKLSKKSWFSRK